MPVIDDQVVENTEAFVIFMTIVGGSAVGSISGLGSQAAIVVIDNDGKQYVGAKPHPTNRTVKAMLSIRITIII